MKIWICCIVCIAAFVCAAFADGAVFKMPDALQTVDEEAFYGTGSLCEVVLPQTITRIEARAFAFSSVRRINLPESIVYIADDAFEGCDLEYAAAQSAYCKKWCADHGIKTDIPGSHEGDRDTDF